MHRPFPCVVLFIVCSIMIHNIRSRSPIKPALSFVVESYRIGYSYYRHTTPYPPISIIRRPHHQRSTTAATTTTTLRSWNVRMELNTRNYHHLITPSPKYASNGTTTATTTTIKQGATDLLQDGEETDIMDLDDDIQDDGEDSIAATTSTSTSTSTTRSSTTGNTDNSTTTNNTNTKTPPMLLSWDKFEYSKFPKADARFGGHSHNHTFLNNNNNATDDDELPKEVALERLHDQETILDQQYSQTVSTQHQLWSSIPTNTVRIATDFLQSYLQPERIQRIQTVLQQRTQNVRFLFESKSRSKCNRHAVYGVHRQPTCTFLASNIMYISRCPCTFRRHFFF